jgi:opacity protein-like surface antigen
MTRTLLSSATALLGACLLVASGGLAQGYDEPLRIQGMDHNTLPSAASRATGGTTLGLSNDVGVLFVNPAALQSLKGFQVSLGGVQQSSKASQAQQYSPLKYYSNFSLLMEGRTGTIPDPRFSDSLGIIGVNVGDTVQRPYDAIGPNWSHERTKRMPLQVIFGTPFSIGSTQLAVGLGVVEYANLNHFYQNNNVLSPAILSERPLPLPRPQTDSLPIVTDWSQYSRSREGSLRGYGGGLSVGLAEGLSVGMSAMLVRGSTDDSELHVARGRMTFYTNYFRLDSVYGHREMVGTSDFKGAEFTLSAVYRGRYLTLGGSLKPPATITRTYSSQVRIDSTGTSESFTVNGQDQLKLPWRGTIGLSLAPRGNLTLGLEYELRSYGSAVYTQEDGTVSNPWLSSTAFHGGMEFRPSSWIALRGGIRTQAEVFEGEGNPLVGEPVSSTIYSAGVGLSFEGIHLNVAYEYGSMKYQDVWGSAISRNDENRHTVIADVTYELPWGIPK